MPLGRHGRSVLLAALVVAAVACDSALSYRPSDWRHTGEYRWATTSNELDVEMGPLGSPSGEEELAPELTIHNSSLSSVVVTGGRLRTGSGVFPSDAVRPGAEKPFTIGAGETARVTLRFPLGRTIREALVAPVTLEIEFRTGSGPRALTIAMQKT